MLPKAEAVAHYSLHRRRHTLRVPTIAISVDKTLLEQSSHFTVFLLSFSAIDNMLDRERNSVLFGIHRTDRYVHFLTINLLADTTSMPTDLEITTYSPRIQTRSH